MTAIILITTYIREEKIAYLRAKVSSLKKKDREQFYSLFDCKQEEGKILPTISNSPLGSSGHKKSASGIFRTNNFALGALDSSPDHGVNIWEKKQCPGTDKANVSLVGVLFEQQTQPFLFT